MSLNNRDAIEGDDESIKELGIVSGDLVHVISTDSTGTEAKSVSESVSKSSVGMACSSESGIMKPGVADMETDTVSQHCGEALVYSSAGADERTGI